MSRETTYLYLSSLRSLFAFLARTERILLDPARGLPLPRMNDRLTGRILSREEMRRLVESPSSAKPTGLRDRAMLEFLYSTGLRASESRRLLVADLREDSVFVAAGEGAKDRLVPVGSRALARLRNYLREARPRMVRYRPGTEELWVAQWGKPFGPVMFQHHLLKLGLAAGLESPTCHMIRRSMATPLLAAGASSQEVSGILGHEDLKSLSRYVNVAAREVRETHAATHPREQRPGRSGSPATGPTSNSRASRAARSRACSFSRRADARSTARACGRS